MVGSVVVMGGHLLDAGTVRRTSPDAAGSLILGNLNDTNDYMLEQMEDYFSPLGGLRISTNIWPDRWSKLTLNSMSNTMAGLSGLKTSTLWSNQNCLDDIIALGHECALVAQAAGDQDGARLQQYPARAAAVRRQSGQLELAGGTRAHVNCERDADR